MKLVDVGVDEVSGGKRVTVDEMREAAEGRAVLVQDGEQWRDETYGYVLCEELTKELERLLWLWDREQLRKSRDDVHRQCARVLLSMRAVEAVGAVSYPSGGYANGAGPTRRNEVHLPRPLVVALVEAHESVTVHLDDARSAGKLNNVVGVAPGQVFQYVSPEASTAALRALMGTIATELARREAE